MAGLLHRLPTPNVSLPPSSPKPSLISGGFRRCLVRIWGHVACQGSVTHRYITCHFLPLDPANNTTTDFFHYFFPLQPLPTFNRAAKTVNEEACKSVKFGRVLILFTRNFFYFIFPEIVDLAFLVRAEGTTT